MFFLSIYFVFRLVPISDQNVQQDSTEESFLEELADIFEVKEAKKEKLAKTLAAEIEYQGLIAFFESLDMGLLHDTAYEMKLEGVAPETNNRQKLVDAIISGKKVSEFKEKKKKVEKPKIAKKKPALEVGVTYDDVFQWYITLCLFKFNSCFIITTNTTIIRYNVEELQEFAKKEKIKSSGRKKDLILRILKHLENPDEEEAPKKKPRKRAASTKKKPKKASSEKKQTAEVP